jgi:hypothetical protein
MERLLPEVRSADWIVTLDDNNPPEGGGELEEVFELAVAETAKRRRVGGVGIIGAAFNWKSGFIRRIPDSALRGPVPVDYLGGGFLPMYSVAAIREVGPTARELFFGFVELEFGLRLRRAGYELLAHGDLWLQRRKMWDRTNLTLQASGICKVHWQKYYRIRNYIWMMARFGRLDLSLRWAAIQCFGKPAYSFLRSPKTGVRGFLQAVAAASDGFRGRLGRTVEPPAGPPSRE